MKPRISIFMRSYFNLLSSTESYFSLKAFLLFWISFVKILSSSNESLNFQKPGPCFLFRDSDFKVKTTAL